MLRRYEILSKGIDEGKILNAELIDNLLSKDVEKSTEAHVSNLWFTRKYNREREKLFYYAMKLNKEFVLSSRCCRDNFKTLTQYWGFEKDENNERISFHKEDREAFVGALYQTLFLLVPVISTTFASVGTFFRDVKDAGVFGTLIVDEAGQAQPHMAVGALYRSRRAIVVGDPKQVEPVVTDDLKLLKRVFDAPELKPYTSQKTISVQKCADEMNVFGTYLENMEHSDYPDWVGCPLLVHRRCISPMYEISNTISYHGLMKKKTQKPDEKTMKSFIYEKSQWIQVKGKAEGSKNYFVAAQGKKVCEMLEVAFAKSNFPDVYIISPFTTVIAGLRNFLWEYIKKNPTSAIAKCEQKENGL